MEHDKTNWVLITKDNYLTLQPRDSVKTFERGKESKIHQLTDDEILYGQATMSNGITRGLLSGKMYVYREPEVFDPKKSFEIKYRLSSLDGSHWMAEFDSEDEALEYVFDTIGNSFRYNDFTIIKVYRFKK